MLPCSWLHAWATVMLIPWEKKDYTGPAIGNNKLEATNVITISELKEKYATQIERGLYKQVDEDIKILGIVTGNDLGGNLYNQICLQDKTGGILVCIGKSGLYGELPVGQQVLIDCKGLYIGGYGKQAELGGVYTNTNKGSQSIGKGRPLRMGEALQDYR